MSIPVNDPLGDIFFFIFFLSLVKFMITVSFIIYSITREVTNCNKSMCMFGT